jgi:hypothetical protein
MATKCEACERHAFVYARWGTQGQKAILCERHASELHERISGAVASLRIPSPTYVPADVYLRSKAAVRDDRAAMRDIA